MQRGTVSQLGMEKPTISILGCGYLGLPVAQALVAKGWRVRGSTTTKQRLISLVEAGIEPYLLRLTPRVEGPALDDFFRSEQLFINFPPGRRRPDVEAFLSAAIKALIARMTGVRFVVFASSTSVYAAEQATEREATAPSTASGRALLDAEAQLARCQDFSTTILRFGGLYGYARQPGRFAHARTNGAARVNLVHRDDAVAVTVRVLEESVRNEVFNVVADRHPTKDAFYRQAAAWLGQPAPVLHHDPTLPVRRISNARLKRRLGYHFLHPDPMVRAP